MAQKYEIRRISLYKSQHTNELTHTEISIHEEKILYEKSRLWTFISATTGTVTPWKYNDAQSTNEQKKSIYKGKDEYMDNFEIGRHVMRVTRMGRIEEGKNAI